MTWPHYLALWTLVSPFVLYACFLLLFNRMPNCAKAMDGPWYFWVVLLIGVAADLYVNLVIGTVLFFQLPNVNRGFLSARMDDLIRNGSGWRQSLAVQIVGRLLEPFDQTGQHTTYGVYAKSNPFHQSS